MSVEEKLDTLADTLMVMKDLMTKKGFFDEGPGTSGVNKVPQMPVRKRKAGKGDSSIHEVNSMSEMTIYHNILDKQGEQGQEQFVMDPDDAEIVFRQKENRESTSSEEQVNTSDETIMEVDIHDQFIADCTAEAERRRSGNGREEFRDPGRSPRVDTAAEQIKEAEASKLQMIGSKGNNIPSLNNNFPVHSALYDDEYQIIGGNVDSALQSKIINHEYVDFSRLLPKDRVQGHDDHHMELISKGGQTYFVPMADREMINISNFNRWEQAFCVFSNIYTKRYPHKATELIQYNQVIFTAAQSFTWDNVYQYDKEFRLHMANFPQRSWSVILQQAWTMCLKDRIRFEQGYGPKNNTNNNKSKREPCKRFNHGLCTAGLSCKYDHCCTVPECGKFGHGAHICRKRQGQTQSMTQSTVGGGSKNNNNPTQK